MTATQSLPLNNIKSDYCKDSNRHFWLYDFKLSPLKVGPYIKDVAFFHYPSLNEVRISPNNLVPVFKEGFSLTYQRPKEGTPTSLKKFFGMFMGEVIFVEAHLWGSLYPEDEDQESKHVIPIFELYTDCFIWESFCEIHKKELLATIFNYSILNLETFNEYVT